jgi:tetratricopeptide (TPR) repeat protein
MTRHHKVILLFAIFLLAGSTSRAAFPQEKKTFYAYSMKVAQARVQQAIKQGIDWRKKQPDLFYLSGITKPLAVVVDTSNNDWILIGERDQKSSVLTLDDWVAALRARFIHGERDPGVTIDPQCPQGKEGCRDFTRQDVQFFGGIEDTHFGQVCYEADWLMKRIALGLEKLPVAKLETYYQLSLGEHRRAGGNTANVWSRFWFYPIVSRVNVIGDVVLLEKFQMGIFTEVLRAEVNGKAVADLTNFEHYPSDGFSRSLTDNYDAVAETREVLETLRGLARLAALAKGLTQVDVKPRVDYFLTKYPREDTRTPKSAEVLTVKNEQTDFGGSGGVELMALATRLKDGDTNALKGLVAGARPSQEVLGWGVEIESHAGQVVGIYLPPGLTDPSQIAPLFAQAAFLYRKKHYDAAIESYGKLLELNPNLAEAYYSRGGSYGEKRDYDRAVADFDKAIALNPNLAEAYYNRGIANHHKRNYDQAIADFDKAIALNPDNAGAYYDRGLSYFRGKRDYDKAIADFDKAIALSPNDAIAHTNRGVAYVEGKRDYDRAIADFDKAIALSPNDAIAHTNRGVAYVKGSRNYDRAFADFDRAILLKPSDANAFHNRARAYHEKGELDHAIQDYNQVIALETDCAEAYKDRGVAYYDKGNFSRAIQDFNQAISRDPRDAEAYYNRGIAHDKDDHDRAIKDFDLAILLNPKLVEAYNSRGIVYYDKGDFNHAIQDVTHAISIEPNFAKAYNTRGYFYAQKVELNLAIQDFTQAISLNPQDAVPYLNRGGAYWRKGVLDRAIQDYSQAISLDPKFIKAYQYRASVYRTISKNDLAAADEKIAQELSGEHPLTPSGLATARNEQQRKAAGEYFNRGNAHLDKGKLDRATQDFDQAISLNPQFVGAYNNRGEAYWKMGELRRAVQDYSQAIRLDPKFVVAYQNRARAYRTVGMNEMANVDEAKVRELRGQKP